MLTLTDPTFQVAAEGTTAGKLRQQAQVTGMKNVRLKAWAVLWAIFLCTAFVPVTDRVAVLLTYGWSGYSAGIRVVWTRPLRFTNGELVSPEKYKMALGITLFGVVAIVVAPALGLPPGLRRRGRAKENASGT